MWEQRGAGKSYSALDPAETLTVEQTVHDTIEVTNYLRERFDEDKIYLVGNSWGAILGVLAAQEHPELFHAFVGAGQMASPRDMVIGRHEARGRAVLAAEWFEMLEAPYKETIVFERSGHRPLFEEAAEFASLMTRILEIGCRGCRRQDGQHFHLPPDKAARLPHNMKVYNLWRIKRLGLERWIEEEAGSIRKKYFCRELHSGPRASGLIRGVVSLIGDLQVGVSRLSGC